MAISRVAYRFVVGPLLVVAVLAALLSAHGAAAGASAQTLVFTAHEEFVDIDPCLGAEVQVTTDTRVVAHLTQRPDGSFIITTNVSGTFTYAPVDESLPATSGHVHQQFSERLQPGGQFLSQITDTFVGKQDGQQRIFHQVIRGIVDASGEVILEVERVHLDCP